MKYTGRHQNDFKARGYAAARRQPLAGRKPGPRVGLPGAGRGGRLASGPAGRHDPAGPLAVAAAASRREVRLGFGRIVV